MNKNITDKDKKDWENFLSKRDPIPNKETDFSKTKKHKPISFDLHGYSLEGANRKIKDLINTAFENNINKLTIVTGKGLHSKNEKNPFVSKNLSILKYSVPEYIKDNKELMNMIHKIKDASIEDGGSGAFYIYLKKKTRE